MKKIFIILIAILIIMTPAFFASSYNLEVDYPTISGADPSGGLLSYIRYVYLFALGAVGLAAFGAIVYGGILYMISGTNVVSQQEAKSWITGAIGGIVLAMSAYLILNTINPDLVKLKAPDAREAEQQLMKGAIQGLTEGQPCTPQGYLQCNTGLKCENYICTPLSSYP